MRRKILFYTFLFLFLIWNVSVYAWKPVSHVLLKDFVVDSLNTNNYFKIAMSKYPIIANWGAVAPDLGYNMDNSGFIKFRWMNRMKYSVQYSDIVHYDHISDFTKALVKEALSSYKTATNKADTINSLKFMAFIGGWITHIAGDFNAHSIYVAPEAGYFISNETGRETHSELENIADAYLYNKYEYKYYYLPDWDFDVKKFWKPIFGINAKSENNISRRESELYLKDMLDSAIDKFQKLFESIYNTKLNANIPLLASTYDRIYGEGSGFLAGFSAMPVHIAKQKIKIGNREHNIDSAFKKSVYDAINFLNNANSDSLSFSSGSNLDIGDSATGTIAITIKVNVPCYSRGTNHIYIQFVSKDSIYSPKYEISSKYGPLQFYFYKNEIFHFYLNLSNYQHENYWDKTKISYVILSSRKRRGHINHKFFAEDIKIEYDGDVIGRNLDKNTMIEVKKPLKISINKI